VGALSSHFYNALLGFLRIIMKMLKSEIKLIKKAALIAMGS
jgi:hypothetical protein